MNYWQVKNDKETILKERSKLAALGNMIETGAWGRAACIDKQRQKHLGGVIDDRDG